MHLCLISDQVKALNDIWLIGDLFLRHSYSALQNLKSEAVVEKKPYPYIYDFFNVTAFYQQSGGQATESLHKIFNSLIEGLNEKERLPRFIFVIPDRDIILQANHFKYGMHIILEDVLTWLVKKIEKAIFMQREDLKSKCLGAVGHDPRIIWIKMIQRPLIKNHVYNHYNNVVNLRRKFNNTLEEVLLKAKNSHVIDPEDALDMYTHFDNLGNLSAEGKKQFWKHIDNQFKRYDRGEIDLKPFERKQKVKATITNKKQGKEPQYRGEDYDEYYTKNYKYQY